MQRRTRSAKISAESAMCPMTSTAVHSPNRVPRRRSTAAVRTMRASVAASSASVRALSSSYVSLSREPLLERAQIVRPPEEVAHELGGGLGAAGRKDLVTVAARDGRVHQVATECRMKIL